MFKCRNCDAIHDFANPCASCPNGKWWPEFCTEQRLNPIELIGKYMKLNQEDANSEIAKRGKELLENIFTSDKKNEQNLPSLTDMTKSLFQSATRWMRNGLVTTDEETLKTRIETCKACEFWNPNGFNGTGRCTKCGCSTWAKLRMATEKCPLGKW